MRVTAIFVLFLYFFKTFNVMCVEKITYASIERPVIGWFDKKYFNYVNMTSFRYGRNSPVYYMNMVMEISIPFDNKVLVSFYFYQFLSNRYHRSFVEMHWKWCDLIHKDVFFGTALKQGKWAQPCPYPPGVYDTYNMTILPEAIPNGFPFTKGRIMANFTYLPTKDFIGWGHVDMELKTLKVKERKPKQKL